MELLEPLKTQNNFHTAENQWQVIKLLLVDFRRQARVPKLIKMSIICPQGLELYYNLSQTLNLATNKYQINLEVLTSCVEEFLLNFPFFFAQSKILKWMYILSAK